MVVRGSREGGGAFVHHDLSTPRAALIADTVIALIADRGLRGLTHRAVDEAAGLPAGSASNHARTRAALLALALTRIADLETAGSGSAAADPDRPPRDLLLDGVASGVHGALTGGLPLTLARLDSPWRPPGAPSCGPSTTGWVRVSRRGPRRCWPPPARATRPGTPGGWSAGARA